MKYHIGLLVAATTPTLLYQLSVLTSNQAVMIYMMIIIGIILGIHESLQAIRKQTEVSSSLNN